MRLRFVSDGTPAGTDVFTSDGERFGRVRDFQITMDWQVNGPPTAKVTLSLLDHVEVVAESQLECIHDGRRYSLTDIGPADGSDGDAD